MSAEKPCRRNILTVLAGIFASLFGRTTQVTPPEEPRVTVLWDRPSVALTRTTYDAQGRCVKVENFTRSGTEAEKGPA